MILSNSPIQTSLRLYTSFSLWHVLVIHIRKIRPLAAPLTLDLTIADLPTLRKLAFRTSSLMRNLSPFSSSSYAIPRHVRSVPLGRDEYIFAVIPGSNIIITGILYGLGCSGTPSLKCWDMAHNRCVGKLAYSAIWNVSQSVPCFEVPGQYLHAFVVSTLEDARKNER